MKKLNFIKDIERHEALNNKFYDLFLKQKLKPKDFSIFARNYGEWIQQFPILLAKLFISTSCINEQAEYIKILYSECGYGDSSRVHGALFNDFITCLGKQFKPTVDFSFATLEKKHPILNSTLELIQGSELLYTHKLKTIASGAVLALEWQAYHMLCQLYEGARNYIDLWENLTDFHEACEYFYAHIGHTEKLHKQQSLTAVLSLSKSKIDYQNVKEGFNKQLSLISNFWKGIFREIEKNARSKSI